VHGAHAAPGRRQPLEVERALTVDRQQPQQMQGIGTLRKSHDTIDDQPINEIQDVSFNLVRRIGELAGERHITVITLLVPRVLIDQRL
jgi:hypothetical protein